MTPNTFQQTLNCQFDMYALYNLTCSTLKRYLGCLDTTYFFTDIQSSLMAEQKSYNYNIEVCSENPQQYRTSCLIIQYNKYVLKTITNDVVH